MKKKIFLAVTALVFILSSFTISAAAESDISSRFADKIISDANKIWTVKFNDSVDFNTVKDNISVEDLNKSKLKISVIPGTDSRQISILPPSGGYDKNQTYSIIIGSNLKSENGKLLGKDVTMDFKVSDNAAAGGGGGGGGGGTGSGNENPTPNYKIHANVLVSPVFPMLKKITVSTELPNVTKYQIEGNNNLFNIGQTGVSIVSQDQNTVRVYLCDDNKILLGTSTLDVSSTKNDISMDITLAD